MIYSIYPLKDATIYETTSSLNSGLDPVLELNHRVVGGTPEVSRILMQFDLTGIQSKIQAGLITNPSFYLSMRTTEVCEIPLEYSIEAYAVSSSWSNGSGYHHVRPAVTDGASWAFRTGLASGEAWATSSYDANVTGSWNGTVGGANWYYDTGSSETFSYETRDVYMDVTDIVTNWLSGSIANNGFIIKHNEAEEKSSTSRGRIGFYGVESNTIWAPRLMVHWDDSSFITGSLEAIGDGPNVIWVKVSKTYNQADLAKIRVFSRDRYPAPSYSTQSRFTTPKYLPPTSYYEVLDAFTDTVIIPFDTGSTKLSCDSNGNYFRLWMESLQPERYYRVRIKVDTDGGLTSKVYDNTAVFKVSR